MSQKQLQAWHAKNLMNLYIHAHINVEELIGVSLSKSHTYTLCHYCEMVATAAGNKVSKHLEAACNLKVRVQHLGMNKLLLDQFPASPAYSHLGTVSSHCL